MILVPTRICNSNTCRYCGVFKKDFEKRYFQEEDPDLKTKISFLSSKLADKNIRFFGGEPLLRFDTIRQVTESLGNGYSFALNSNLSLLEDDMVPLFQEHNIKVIVSCNGIPEIHSKSRGIPMMETLKIFSNIKKVTGNGIPHQINVVVEDETAGYLRENLEYIAGLGGRNINLIPVHYKGWSKEGLLALEKAFTETEKAIQSSSLPIRFINHQINNPVPLFNSEITIDSDGKIYPSMVILESFFLKEKEKIVVSDMSKSLGEIQDNFQIWEEENHSIYALFINKVLKTKFPDIISSDEEASSLFHWFLENIAKNQ